jgi:hypothetical protein
MPSVMKATRWQRVHLPVAYCKIYMLYVEHKKCRLPNAACVQHINMQRCKKVILANAVDVGKVEPAPDLAK